MRYAAPKGTQVSTVAPGGEEIRVVFKTQTLDVLDEVLDATLSRLADDKANPVKRAKKSKED